MTPVVRPGQVWADCDPRNEGRTLRVLVIVAEPREFYPFRELYAECEPLTRVGGGPISPGAPKRVSIRLDRFKPTSNGYRLVSEPPDTGDAS